MPFASELIPWLPLVYIAWSDGDLSSEEQRALLDRAESRAAVPPQVRAWLDPERPPAPAELASMLELIVDRAAGLPESDRRSLADLGAAMAALSGGEADGPTQAAMRELEDALGVLGSEAARSLLSPERPSAADRIDESPFSVAALAARFDGPYGEIRRRVRDWLAEESHRPPYRLDKERHRDDVRGWLAELAELGIGKLAFPGVTTERETMGDFMAAFETLAFGDLSLVIKAGVQWGLFGGSIYFLGDEAQRELFLPAAADLSLPGCFAMTESGHGSNVAEIETRARYLANTGEFEIHSPSESSRKDYIGGAARDARWATVFAQLEVAGQEHGVHAFLVPLRGEGGEALPGVRLVDNGEKIGLHGVDNGRIWFERVRIPGANLLRRFARLEEGVYKSEIPNPNKRFFTMLGTLVGGRISVGAAAISASKVGLAIAIRYAAERRQFGPPGEPEIRLLDYPAHQRRLMPLLATTAAMHFAVADIRERYLSGTGDARQVEALAAGIKALATEHTTSCLQTCRECCGGQGYLATNRIGVLRADTDVFTTFEGDNTVLLQLVAKSLLSEFKSSFEEAPLRAVVRRLTERARSRLSDKNYFAVRRAESGHLRGRDTQERLLGQRTGDLQAAVAARLKRRIDDGIPSASAVVALQNHLIALARAHVEEFVFVAFSAAIRATEDAEVKRALVSLSDLYALWRIERDAAWFLENGYLEERKLRGIRREVEALCGEIAALALPLVDAFGIPDRSLAAPIAFADPAREKLATDE